MSTPVAVVTGAGGPTGIGFACARELALTHALVIAATSPRIDERVGELRRRGADAIGFIGDLRDSSEAQRLVDITIDRWGRIDVLINNAGMLSTTGSEEQAPADQTSDDQWRAVVSRNLDTNFFVTRAALTPMAQQGFGRIVNVGQCLARSWPTVATPLTTRRRRPLSDSPDLLLSTMPATGSPRMLLLPAGLRRVRRRNRECHGRRDTDRTVRAARGGRGACRLPRLRWGVVHQRAGIRCRWGQLHRRGAGIFCCCRQRSRELMAGNAEVSLQPLSTEVDEILRAGWGLSGPLTSLGSSHDRVFRFDIDGAPSAVMKVSTKDRVDEMVLTAEAELLRHIEMALPSMQVPLLQPGRIQCACMAVGRHRRSTN